MPARRPRGATHFINVDLDLECDEPLTPLVQHWGDAVFTLRHEEVKEGGGWMGGFELSHRDRTAEQAILEFIELVRALPEALQLRWMKLRRRSIDVGVQAGTSARSWQFSLQPATLAALEEIQAELVCTIYPPSQGTSASLPSLGEGE